MSSVKILVNKIKWTQQLQIVVCNNDKTYIYIYMVSILYRIVYSEKNKQLNYFLALKLNPAVPAHDLMEEYNLR